jgi:DNA gyrase subunit A
MIVVPGGENGEHQLLTACRLGYGKRTPLAEYPVKGRGTRGVISIDANDRNGDVVGMKLVGDDDDVMLITEKGILMRTRVAEIRETGRNAAGVRLIRLDEGDRLVALAKVDAEEEDEKPAEGAAEPTDGATQGSSDGATPPPASAEASEAAPPAASPEASSDGQAADDGEAQ